MKAIQDVLHWRLCLWTGRWISSSITSRSSNQQCPQNLQLMNSANGPLCSRSPLAPRDPRSPLRPRHLRSPLGPRDPRSPLGPRDPRSPLGSRDPRFPFGPRGPRSPLGPKDASGASGFPSTPTPRLGPGSLFLPFFFLPDLWQPAATKSWNRMVRHTDPHHRKCFALSHQIFTMEMFGW